MHDLVIRGGTIVDGSGKPAFTGDVAIQDGWIAEVGNVQGRGKDEIDAKGMLVTPGFVDVHTHYDGQMIWSERAAPSSDHGVTTVMFGNCGIGFAPCRPSDRQDLIRLMVGVEDIPGAVTDEGLTWDWESFPEFLNALERRRHDIDFGALVPHSAVRVFVMGKRALNMEAATAEDRAAMARIVREGLDVGALGFGTSRLKAHRSSTGDLIPSYSAEEQELTDIAAALNAAGKGVFQIVTDFGFTTLEAQMPILIKLAQTSGRTLTYTHAQPPKPSNWQEALHSLETANKQPGVKMKAQLLPRPVGMMLGLTASAHPFCLFPTYQKIKDLPLDQRVAEMRKPEVRAAILAEKPIESPNYPLFNFVRRFSRMFPTGKVMNYEPALSDSIEEIAKRQGRTSDEVAYDELLKEDGKALMMLALGNYEECSLDWMETMLESKNVVLGLGDGGAHYGMICDASFTTFALTHWTRDRSHGKIPLESMVYRLSREAANLIGLDDRGLLAPGYRANANVIDYDKLALFKPQIVADLPAGGRRLHQTATGYIATIVNGKPIVRDGKPTEERPGRLVRGAQPSRASAPLRGAAE